MGSKLKKIHNVLERFAADRLGFAAAASVGLLRVEWVLVWLSAPIVRRTEMNPGENECQGNGDTSNVRCYSRKEKSSSRTAPVEQSFRFLGCKLDRKNNSQQKVFKVIP